MFLRGVTTPAPHDEQQSLISKRSLPWDCRRRPGRRQAPVPSAKANVRGRALLLGHGPTASQAPPTSASDEPAQLSLLSAPPGAARSAPRGNVIRRDCNYRPTAAIRGAGWVGSRCARPGNQARGQENKAASSRRRQHSHQALMGSGCLCHPRLVSALRWWAAAGASQPGPLKGSGQGVHGARAGGRTAGVTVTSGVGGRRLLSASRGQRQAGRALEGALWPRTGQALSPSGPQAECAHCALCSTPDVYILRFIELAGAPPLSKTTRASMRSSVIRHLCVASCPPLRVWCPALTVHLTPWTLLFLRLRGRRSNFRAF